VLIATESIHSLTEAVDLNTKIRFKLFLIQLANRLMTGSKREGNQTMVFLIDK
jgi:hypothetical protein